MVVSEAVSPSQDNDRRIAHALLAWFSLPQLGYPDGQIPVSAHPVSDCATGCSDLDVQILHPNLLTEWVRLPLHLPERDGPLSSSDDAPGVVMDAYLESVLMKGDYELFASELMSSRDWCAPLSSNYRWVGGFAELASVTIGQEISRHYFPPFSSRRCQHLSLGNGEKKALMWDPRLVLPTPAGRSIRRSIWLKEHFLCGPHPLLRSIERFLPDVIPIGIQVDHSPSALFRSTHTSDLDFVSIGAVAIGNCRVPPALQLVGVLQTALSVSVRMMRPIGRLLPRALRTAARRNLPVLFSQELLKKRLRRRVTVSLGFSPSSAREEAL